MIRLGSVNLIVKDMEAAERFYVDVLGLTFDGERSKRPSFVLLRAANCMVIFQQAGSGREIPSTSSQLELAFEINNFGEMLAKLGDRAKIQQMGWGKVIETTDPEGNRVSLYRLS